MPERGSIWYNVAEKAVELSEGICIMSRDGDSRSMVSRRRVWYYEHRRYLQNEAEQTDAQTTPVGVTAEISTSGGDLTPHSEICYNTHCYEQ